MPSALIRSVGHGGGGGGQYVNWVGLFFLISPVSPGWGGGAVGVSVSRGGGPGGGGRPPE